MKLTVAMKDRPVDLQEVVYLVASVCLVDLLEDESFDESAGKQSVTDGASLGIIGSET